MSDEIRPIFKGRKDGELYKGQGQDENCDLGRISSLRKLRNQADDPVRTALGNAAKQLKAEGKPLIRKK